jgi:hypothetical protein
LLIEVKPTTSQKRTITCGQQDVIHEHKAFIGFAQNDGTASRSFKVCNVPAEPLALHAERVLIAPLTGLCSGIVY